MKTLTKNSVSLYLFDDSVPVTVGIDSTIVGGMSPFVIGDCTSSNSVLATVTQAPDDWAGGKYLYTGAWEINPSYVSASKPEIDLSVQNAIVRQVQDRLDAFAKTRNYDSMLSACTYVTSTVTKFQVEGQYCVEARDATWAALYAMLAEVLSGARPMPGGFAEIESELPVLAWPN